MILWQKFKIFGIVMYLYGGSVYPRFCNQGLPVHGLLS